MMMSYAFKRRAFLGMLGGAFGLRALLENIEAHAQGMTTPKRLLVMHRPVGSYRAAWLCQRSGADFTLSRMLEPFAALKPQTIVLDGLDMKQEGPGGGHEAGTVFMMTGAATRYTRAGQPETDDAAADAPSIDQLLLAKSEALRAPAIDSLQVSCDDRIDAQELSTRRLSYSTNRVALSAVQGTGQQNEPMPPELSPLALYTRVFGQMMPGGMDEAQAARILASKKSVLDFSRRELDRLRTLAPASASPMIDAHAQAILAAESELVVDTPDGCVVPMPPPDIAGAEDDGRFKGPDDYGKPETTTADHELHSQLGKAHQAVLKAALACDLTRVVTFQWSPGTNHVSFGGLYPTDNVNDPIPIMMHHPVSHRIGADTFAGSDPIPTNKDLEFLCRVELWYNQRIAEFLTELQQTTDVYGGNLLDQTVVPCVTEVCNALHDHADVPTVVFGGKNLGFKGGQLIDANRPHADMWLTIAAALGVSMDQLQGEGILAGNQTGVINEIWAPPTV